MKTWLTDSKKFKKVLMISYAFPPMGGSGVQRTLKFAKYLPDFQWMPLIIKADLLNEDEKDYSFLKELNKNIKVYNTYYPRFRFPANKDSKIQKNVQYLKKNSQFIKNLIQMIKTSICVPDDSVAWLPFALYKGIRVIKENKIDLIYTTSNPYTDHLIGYFIKKITNLPWVVDFRDPWVENIRHANKYYKGIFGFLRKKVDGYLEKVILRNADRVISTTPTATELFLNKLVANKNNKFITITNGFDEADFLKISDLLPNEKFTIVYSGSFRRVSPRNFLIAIRNLITRNNEIRNNLKLIFVGDFDLYNKKIIIEDYSLQDVVDIKGYLSHSESISILMSSDLLLLLLNSDERDKYIIPGKIFEYMRAKKPILTLAPEGIVAEIINKYRIGKVVDPDNIVGISNLIEEMYYRYKEGILKIESVPIIDNFERKKQTGKLADCFNELIAV